MYTDLLSALAVIGSAIAIGAILEYCAHAWHYGRRKRP
jgi:hypothetical protein